MSASPAGGPAPESERRRLLRLGILGCGTALLVLIVLGTVVGFVLSRHPRQLRAALGAVFGTLASEVEKSFSTDVTAAERQEFRAAWERFHDAWNAGRIEMPAADALRRRLLRESGKERISPEDVRSLTRFLDSLARGTPGTRAA